MLSTIFRRRPLRALAAALVAPATLAVVTACGGAEAPTTADGKTVLRYQGQTGLVTTYELADNLGYFSKISLRWEGDTTSGPANIQAAATKQIEFGSAFNGAVVKLAAGGAPVQSVLSSYGSDAKSYTANYVREDTAL
ncbi:ABC transporter substrate-binding protein, partial [Nocardia sp. NPDC058497]